MNDETVRLLKELIAIDSVNPSLAPGGAGESEIARFIADVMRGFGMDVAIEDAAPGRPNVIGTIDRGKLPAWIHTIVHDKGKPVGVWTRGSDRFLGPDHPVPVYDHPNGHVVGYLGTAAPGPQSGP